MDQTADHFSVQMPVPAPMVQTADEVYGGVVFATLFGKVAATPGPAAAGSELERKLAKARLRAEGLWCCNGTDFEQSLVLGLGAPDGADGLSLQQAALSPTIPLGAGHALVAAITAGTKGEGEDPEPLDFASSGDGEAFGSLTHPSNLMKAFRALW